MGQTQQVMLAFADVMQAHAFGDNITQYWDQRAMIRVRKGHQHRLPTSRAQKAPARLLLVWPAS